MPSKIIFLALLIIVSAFTPLTGIYDLSVQTISGTTVSLSSFSGKKIIVAEFDATNYDKSQLLALDSLQRTNINVQVVAIPAKDFSSSVTIQSIQNLVKSLNLSFIITQPGFVKKSAGSNQQVIFKWLTHVAENTHFDNDADQPGQIYLISEKGELYAMLQKGTAITDIKTLATQKTN